MTLPEVPRGGPAFGAPEGAPALLELEDVSVRVDARTVLRDVSLSVARGEIHAVVGSQGAGKSTLVRLIAGLVPRARGRLVFDGRELGKHTPRSARQLGITVLHQEPGLLAGMNAVENIYLNRELKRYLLFNDTRRMREMVLQAFRAIPLEADPDLPVDFHDSPTRQLIDLARLVCFPAKLVVVDDLATRLRPEDVERLHYLLSVLRRDGTTVLYVTGDMDEVFNFASRVTVLDAGSVVETNEISRMDNIRLVQATYATLFSRRKLEKANLELFYLNTLNRNIINNIPIPILVADSRGAVILQNRCLEMVTRRAQTEEVQATVGRFLAFTAAQEAETSRRISLLERAEIPGCAVRTAGGDVPADVHAYPILDDDGSFSGTIYLLDMRKGDEPFMSQAKSYEEPVRSRRALWEIVHEINNPLGIMLNYLTLIRGSSSLEQIRENAEVMGRELKRVRRIFSRLTGAGREGAAESRPGLRAAVEDVIALLKVNLNERIELSLSLSEDPPVPVEPDPLRQVVLNLVINAVEAMPEGGSLRIETGRTAPAAGEWATLRVKDTGVGIPEENREKIFEPFFTTKTDSEARGLGLSLSNDIVCRAGGRIEVEASKGGGTSFLVSIPIG